MLAYKVFRQRKDGTLGSLYMNARARIVPGEVLKAGNHARKGFANRPGWHCLEVPEAPHLKMEGRVMAQVEVLDDNPEIHRWQGQKWILAQKIIVKSIVSPSQPRGNSSAEKADTARHSPGDRKELVDTGGR